MEIQTQRLENQSKEQFREICRKQKQYALKHTITTQLPFIAKDPKTGKKGRIWKEGEIKVNNKGVNNSQFRQFIPQKGERAGRQLFDYKNNRKQSTGRKFKYVYKYLTVRNRNPNTSKEKPNILVLRDNRPIITSEKLILRTSKQ